MLMLAASEPIAHAKVCRIVKPSKGIGWMPDVRVICAIGQRGQLGLRGQLPWEGAKGPEFIADVQRFFELTRGHVLLAGPLTFRSFPSFAFSDRTIVEIRSNQAPGDAIAHYWQRVIYICGGPPVWAAYAPLINHWDITRLPYDGEADRFFDLAWLIAAGNGGPVSGA
jgi:dihydromethanopterin reductase